jgi:mannose-6-phosphate isomerase-like protein (cupin superfamily)
VPGSMIVTPGGAPSRMVVAAGSDVGEWKRLAWGRALHGDLDAFDWHRLPPGAVITEHNHTHTEEIYFILAGTAEMRLGNDWRRIGAGDLVVTPLNARHAIVNVGDTALEFLVIEVVPPAIRDRLPARSL